MCSKIPISIKGHLEDQCMKGCSAVEIAAQVDIAKESTRVWTATQRVWEYKTLVKLLPDHASRMAMVKYLVQNGYLILNKPFDEDMDCAREAPGTSDSVTATTSAVATSAPTDDSATLATSAVACTASSAPPEEEETDSSETPSSDEKTRDRSRRSHSTGTVREAMQAGGMYDKCPPESKLLVGFKKHLSGALQVQNCQQEVDNVSRFLRYMQPEGEPNLEFLTKTTETMDYMSALNNSGLSAATILNYMKNIIRFLQYVKGSVDLNEDGIKIQKYIDFLKTMRKPVARKHSGNVCSTRYDRIVDGMPTVHDCNLVLRSGKKRFLDIYNRMAISKIVVSPTEKTWYRYYCEAVMMLRHFQRPGAVEGMTVREWVNRKLTDGRYLIGIKNHKTGATHVATIALTLEEEAWYQGYYEFIRPEFVRGECDCFFLSARGTKITSGSSDLLRLHESCGIDHGSCTSGQVRRAADTLVATSFTETHAAYMCRSDLMADTHYRMPVPSTMVATAVRLETLPGFTPERYLPTQTDSPGSCMSGKEFSDFQQTFPVSRDCQPPTKKQRVEAGFSENRVYYDRWRKGQYADRQEHLLSYYTYRKPSARKIERLISKEAWTSNCPKAQDILDMWTPALKYVIESDKKILNSCSRQKWKGLAIKSFDGQKGEGVVATTHFTEGDIVCDYHGKVITKAEGEIMMKDQGDQAAYLFFFNAGGEALCIDAQTWPCPCHAGVETFGRKIKHSSKHPNIKPLCVVLRLDDEDVHTILFKATRDIKVDTELKFNYGVNRKSFRGEALDLDWLDE
ncbi:hypothetical protein KUCAC02_026984 [Chaenocephalus aceratus]|nr:hypothetical protein KUCAC02_026984 [Chaenocephalus aceratus]